ncbi:hypothetical protein AYK26_01395 [Euryarchaeota archaeon SM23-78]|nr:MAG: hypothetical protein AYK26_01395 [Euryarchaeota archaeon SM23-78]
MKDKKPLNLEDIWRRQREEREKQQAIREQKEKEDIDNMLRAQGGGEPTQDMNQQNNPEPVKLDFDMKPKEVKEYLDKYVIKQEKAKKYLAIAICYHYGRIKKVQENGNDSDAFIKKNVLMIGNTGVGKTYLVQKLSKLVGVPFIKEDATKFTASGYVGRDVEEMVKDLYLSADENKELAQYGIIYIDEVDKLRKQFTFSKDVGGAEVQHGLLKLMEETEVDVSGNGDPLVLMKAVKKQPDGRIKIEKPIINTKHILFIVGGAFPGLEYIVKKKRGLVREKKPAESPLTEEELRSLGYKAQIEEPEKSDWHDYLRAEDLVDYGFEPELIGRIPIRVGLDDLEADDLYQILKKSEDSIIKQYHNDFDAFGIKVKFTDEALKAFAQKAATEKTGARALVGVIEEYLLDYLYELPSTNIKEFTITEQVIANPRKELIKLIMDDAVRIYSKKIYEQTGIDLSFNKKAIEYLKQKAFNSEQSPSELCEAMFERYIHALKLYGQNKFTVTEAVIKNPDTYLKGMLIINGCCKRI